MFLFRKKVGVFWTQYLLVTFFSVSMLSWLGCGHESTDSPIIAGELDPYPDFNDPDFYSKQDAWCKRQPKTEPPVLPNYEPDLSKKGEIIEGIYLAPDLPDELYRALAKDIRSLRRMKVVDPDGKIAALLNLTGPVTGSALLGWLTQRVKFIVKGSYQMEQSVPRTPNNNFAAANPGLMYMGRHDGIGRPYHVEIPGWGWIPVESPRVGIVEMGRQLMNPDWSETPQTTSRERIAMLFHEGRHSDGRQENTSFPHVRCLDTGTESCDHYANGPIAIQSAVLKGLILACENCAPSAKKWQLSLAEGYLEDIISTEIADERPAGLIGTEFFISDIEPAVPQVLRGFSKK